MMGIVSIWDITSVEDLKKRAFCERPAIKIGSRWVLERKNINNVEDLIGIVKEETVDVYIGFETSSNLITHSFKRGWQASGGINFTIKQGGVA
jgi:hypothetical protein